METEHQTQERLKGLTDTTKIIIAHQISAVSNVDEIIIRNQGKTLNVALMLNYYKNMACIIRLTWHNTVNF